MPPRRQRPAHQSRAPSRSDYQSNLYLEDSDTCTTYRVSLEQVETRPPLPSGR
ncbi:hypothetical protein [Pseudomonas sp. 52 E 6]|uniref:hypothetical protein n=1 Tax=Pseudomonas sp. 52 E 6 TaxID=1844106 RepID=UPI00081284AE|nr:hypothetical protein [Pseudomonas sp. 52 E 6]CRM50999.1 hypothetical protein [Pseudomonas sp. 52 E 6]